MNKFNNGDVTDVLDSFFIDYAIDEDDDEANVQELMQQRSDMSEAVNEWYAKAKAFDAISYIIKKRANDDFSIVNNDYEAGILRAYEVMECDVDDFYRGDTDA